MHIYAHSLASSDISTLKESWRTVACQKALRLADMALPWKTGTLFAATVF